MQAPTLPTYTYIHVIRAKKNLPLMSIYLSIIMIFLFNKLVYSQTFDPFFNRYQRIFSFKSPPLNSDINHNSCSTSNVVLVPFCLAQNIISSARVNRLLLSKRVEVIYADSYVTHADPAHLSLLNLQTRQNCLASPLTSTLLSIKSDKFVVLKLNIHFIYATQHAVRILWDYGIYLFIA